jgi:hypothetical protein
VRTQERLTARIEVEDATGARQLLQEFTSFTELRPLDGEVEWMPGMKSFWTVAGGHVNVNADGSFTELHTGRVLRRVA